MPTHYPVIPAKAGIQLQPAIDVLCASLDTGLSHVSNALQRTYSMVMTLAVTPV